MEQILAIALQGMHQDMMRLDQVGMNIVNAQTAGYKRVVLAVRPFGQMVEGTGGATLAAPMAASGDPAELAAAGIVLRQTDPRPGTLKSTGASLDLAIAGAGYFEVQTPQGPAYTRQGNFHLDAQDRLVTAQGYAVMGKGGEIFLTHSAPVIDAAGQIFDNPASGAGAAGTLGAAPLAQLRVVQFDAAATLQSLGDGLLAGGAEGRAVDAKELQIRQGFLENSNVNATQEMVQLMQSMRHFESMQRVAAGYDQMLDTAIRKLGNLA